MRISLRVCVTMMVSSVLMSSEAWAGSIVAIPTPGSATTCCGVYTSATTVLAFPGPDGTTFTSLSNATQTVSFSTEFMTLSVPDSWGQWSASPNSENPTPVVAWSEGSATATLTLSLAAGIFGFELEPADTTQPTHMYTVTFLSGATSLGSIQLDVAGAGGARLFAGEVVGSANPNLIDRVTVSGGSDFALANVRYGIESIPGTVVPEPGSLLLIAAGGVLLMARRRARLPR